MVALRVFNYKGFADSGAMQVRPGFNVVVGRNNVGKTALAEASGLHFVDKPHRSRQTIPTPDAHPDPNARVEVDVRIESDELSRVLTDELPVIYVPMIGGSEILTENWFNSAVSNGCTITVVYGSGGVLSVQLLGHLVQARDEQYIRFDVDPRPIDSSGYQTPPSAICGGKICRYT